MKAYELFTYGLAKEIVEVVQWNNRFGVWEIIDRNALFKDYYTKSINPNSVSLTPDQERKRKAIHIEDERKFWQQTQELWGCWSNDMVLFDFVKANVESYLQNAPVEVKWKKAITNLRDMMHDPDGRKLKALHSLIDGYVGKRVACVILAAHQIGWFTTLPTYPEVISEFPNIGTRSGYDKYRDTNEQDQTEITITAQKLEDLAKK